MAEAVLMAAAAVGGEAIAVYGTATAFSWAAVGARLALSAGLSLVSESLSSSSPQAQAQPPLSAEISARKQLIRASAAPRRVIYGEARVSGALLYAGNSTVDPAALYLARNPDVAAAGQDAWTHYQQHGKGEGRLWPGNRHLHLVIAIAGHRCHAITGIWLGDELVGALDGAGNVTAGRFAGYVRIRAYLGTTDQVTDPYLTSECPEWGAEARPGKGLTYAILRLENCRDIFPSGIPTPRFDVQGKADILDVRTGTTGYTNNAALCALDYILWKNGFQSGLDEVVQPTWIAAANVCDENVATPGGGTQKRYAINGSFTLDRGRAEVLDQMRQAMAGAVNYTMGQWYGHAGAADTPVMDISERDLRGPYRIRPRVPDDKVYNAVKGTYTEPAFETETDFPPVTNAMYETEDGGQRLFKDVKLPFEKDAYRAQRLAKIDLERHRQGIVVELSMRIRSLKLRPWNIVRLSLAKPGFTNKLFRVIDWKFSLFGGADLVLEEYADAIYTWSSLEATTVDPAPDTTLPSPRTVTAPAVPTLSSGTAEIVLGGDGAVISRIRVSLGATTDPYARRIELRYKKSAATDWIAGPSELVDVGTVWLGPVEDQVAYDVAVRYENGIGLRSAWTTVTGHTVIGETEIPSTVATCATTQDRCFFPKVPDRDVPGYQIRAVPGTQALWSLGVAVHDGMATDSPYPYQRRLTGIQTVMVAAVDRGGRVGIPASATLDFGVIDPLNIAQSYNFAATGFPGTITNGSVVGGHLVADADPAVDYWSIGAEDWWTRDAAPDWWGGSAYLAMQYATLFTPLYSGGEIIIDSTLAGSRSTIEWRTDGATIGDFWAPDRADFWAGADYWGVMPAWQPYIGVIDSVAAQGIQIRVSTDAGPIQGDISALSIRLQMPSKQQVFSDIAIAAGGTRLAPASGMPVVEWIRVEEVNFTVYADGSGATTGRVVDFDPILGPLAQTLNAAGTAVSSTGQSARVSGY